MDSTAKSEPDVQPLGRSAEPAAAGVNASSSASAAFIEEHPSWPLTSRLPVLLSVSIPLNRLRVRDLLSLTPGQTIRSSWCSTEDVPLRAGPVQLAWGEFEVADRRMALRLARLV